jgi:hypothetical protein
VSVCSGRAGPEPLHHRTCGGGAHVWKHRRQSLAPGLWGFGVGVGALLGPEGAAARVCGCVLRFRVQARGHIAGRAWVRAGLVVPCDGSGVRWGVCELDSGCEHLVVFRLLLCSVFKCFCV